jgi:hypothetical protein
MGKLHILEVQDKVDVGIITIKVEEYLAVLERLSARDTVD